MTMRNWRKMKSCSRKSLKMTRNWMKMKSCWRKNWMKMRSY